MGSLFRGRGRRAVVAAFALVLLAVPAAAAQDTVLISRAPGPEGAPGDFPSGRLSGFGVFRGVSVSGDGRLVAFVSEADNFSDEDVVSDETRQNQYSTDVFVRDRATGTTTLVSRGDGPAGPGANSGSYHPSISADGRFVAFMSNADNLGPRGGSSSYDVYVRDLREGTTTLVSRADGAQGAVADKASYEPSISADGRRVAFVSPATNLSDDDRDEDADVFVRDLAAGTTTLASRRSGRDGAAGGRQGGTSAVASGPALSADGTVVAFSSDAVLGEGASGINVWARDLATDATTLVSRADGPEGAAGSDSFAPAISASGRDVAFQSPDRALSGTATDHYRVYVRDLERNSTAEVSRMDGPAGAPADAESRDAAISADGSQVAFTSEGRNMTPGEGPTLVYVRDRAAQTTRLASRASGADGAVADALTEGAEISGDGRVVAFETRATNLTAEPDDSVEQVFARVPARTAAEPVPAQPAPVLADPGPTGTEGFIRPGVSPRPGDSPRAERVRVRLSGRLDALRGGRVRLTGSLIRATRRARPAAAACTGAVLVRASRGTRRAGTRRLRVRDDCRFRAVLRVPRPRAASRGGRVRVRITLRSDRAVAAARTLARRR